MTIFQSTLRSLHLVSYPLEGDFLPLHLLPAFEAIVVYSSLKLMYKPSDYFVITRENHLSSKDQIDAMRRAWISNTEVKLLERKTKLDSQGWR